MAAPSGVFACRAFFVFVFAPTNTGCCAEAALGHMGQGGRGQAQHTPQQAGWATRCHGLCDTWKRGRSNLYFYPAAGGLKKRRKEAVYDD